MLHFQGQQVIHRQSVRFFFLSIFIFLILIHNTHLCLCRSAHRIVSNIFTHIFFFVCLLRLHLPVGFTDNQHWYPLNGNFRISQFSKNFIKVQYNVYIKIVKNFVTTELTQQYAIPIHDHIITETTEMHFYYLKCVRSHSCRISIGSPVYMASNITV